ncbi:MAG: restriction endonuclease subunit S [Bacteroidetes bacterium]|nr:MAG: restriction endonuclease subunit S [Bacteroidota bacterium]
MKKGWELKKLGEVLTIERGGSPRPINKYLTKSANGINWIKISDATASEKYIYETKEKIKLEGLHKTRVVNDGDFILSNSMSFGRPYIMKTTGCIHDGWLVLRQSNKKIFETEFLYYLLSSPIVFQQFNTLAAGSTVRNLNIALVSSVNVPIPPLPEQKRIVSILDETFARITKAKANAEKNLQNARELFESYLQNVFANPGEDWEVKIIKEVCELKSGTTISTSLERDKGDVLYTKIADMNLPENTIEINTSSRFVNRNEIKQNQIIPEGAIIFPKRGGAIATNKKRKIIKPTIVDLNTMAIIPSKKINKNYFFHWFQLFDLNTISSGANIPQINNYSFDDVYIPYPISLKEQQAIVHKIDSLSTETKKLETIYQQKIEALDEVKKSILQKAFSGELKTTDKKVLA